MDLKKNKPTIKEIAARAGVSVATASVAINNARGRVNRDTRRKIMEIAEELGYVPKSKVEDPLGGRSGRIALTLLRSPASFTSTQENFAMELLGAWQRLRTTRFSLELVNSSELDSGALSGVDGIVISGPFLEGDHPLDLPIPAVYVGVHHWNESCLVVDGDNFQAGYLAANAILERCSENIVVLSLKQELVCLQYRLLGIRSAFRRQGLEFDEDSVVPLETSLEDGRAISPERELASIPANTKGLIVLDPQLLWPVLSWVESKGRTIGEDLMLAGIDAAGIPVPSPVPIPVVAMPSFEMGYEAVDMLLSAIAGRVRGNQRRLLPPSLVWYCRDLRNGAPGTNSFRRRGAGFALSAVDGKGGEPEKIDHS